MRRFEEKGRKKVTVPIFATLIPEVREDSNLHSEHGSVWKQRELRLFRSFAAPIHIQSFLNRLRYNDRPTTMSPRRVIKERTAHCFEGAMFAAAALRFLGYPPLIVDLAACNDDDHVIAVFRENGFWGAVAKSNTTLLRFREPVYRDLRELVMSYFEMYFNTKGDKSLVSYSRPVNLARYDHRKWMTDMEDLDFIGDYLFAIKHTNVIPEAQRKLLHKADKEVVKACFLGSIPSGLYKPQ
jgi:hypothetical protein